MILGHNTHFSQNTHKFHFPQNNLCSFDSVHQQTAKMVRTVDFNNLRSGRKKLSYDDLSIEFQAHVESGDGLDAYSPPLWKRSTSESLNSEYSPLLPQTRHCSYQSHAIAESRKELMEMIRNMSESYYELSLKDIVDEQHTLDTSEEPREETSKKITGEAHSEKQKKMVKKKTDNRKGQLMRTESMESSVFLIKMFFPTCLGSKRKKPISGTSAKVSLRPLFGGPMHIEGSWWRNKRCSVSGDSKERVKTECIDGSTKGSSYSSNSRSGF